MKKKMSTYLSLFIMLGSVFTLPITVSAKTNDSGVEEIQVESTQPEEAKSEEIKETTSSQQESIPKDSTKEAINNTTTLDSTQTDQKQQSEVTQSTDQQTRAPTKNRNNEEPILSFFGIRDQDGKYTDTEPVSKQTGTEALFYGGFKLGDFSGQGKNLRLQISIPNKLIKDVIASDTNNQSSKTVETIGDNTIVTYTFSNINGGFTLDVPIKFTNQDYITPEGYQLPIQAQIYEEGVSVPLDTKELVYNYTLKEMRIQKYVYSTSWNSSDGTVVYGGEEDVNKPGYISTDISKTAKVRFSIDNGISYSSYGNRILEKYIIEDKIPDNAVFLPEDNPEWAYDEVNRIARLEKDKEIKNNISFSHDIYLRFPGAKVDEAITNLGMYTGTPKDKTEYEQNLTAEDSIMVKLSSKKPNLSILSTKKISSNWSLYENPNKPEEKEAWEVKWKVGSTINSPTVGIYDFKIRDYNLDNRMKYTKVILPQTTNFQNSVTLKILKEDGQEESVNNAIDLSQKAFTFEVPSESSIKEIVLEGKLIDGKKGYEFEIYSKLKNPSETHILEGQNQTTFYNYMQAVINKDGYSESKGSSDYARLEKIGDPLVSLSKYRSGNANLFLNDTAHFSLSLKSSNLGTTTDRTSMALENVSVIDLLPLGTEYIEDSASIGSLSTNKDEELKKLKTSKVIQDYKNTGRTALIWSLKDFKIETSSSHTSDTNFLSIYYKVKTTKNSLEGKNTNESFLLFNSSDGVKPKPSSLINDTYHIGTDGSPKIIGSSAYFNYTPPKELITYKEIKGNADEGIVKAPGKGHVEVGGTGEYYLNIFNNSEYDQSILNIIDLFPHVGDKSSSKDKEGNRVARNSEFAINLNGPISGPEGYQIYYTTDKIDDSLDETKNFFQNASWQTETTDYQKVTAIKIVMDQGKKLKAGDSVKFEVPFSVPKDITLVDKLAVNSFGTATNSGLDFFESNNIAATLIKYKVEGYLFNDNNKDGKFDKSSEKVFVRHQVELLTEAGQPVLDELGVPVTGVTDATGYYSMDVFEKGSYQVKIITPENYLITTKTHDKEIGAHLNVTGQSDIFSLNVANPTQRVNGGYFINPEALTHVTATKHWEDANNQDGQRPNSIQVQLVANGEAQGDAVELNAGNNWTTTWNDLALKANGQDIVYTVEEGTVPGYTTTVDASDKGNVKIINTHTPETTEIKGTKTWADKNNQDGKRPDKITVNLLANGQQMAEKEVTEADGWKYNFTNLPKFQEGQEIVYTVTENDVPEYNTTIEGYDIINSYTPGKTSVTVTKHWEDANNQDGQRPNSIQVQLVANGEAQGDAVELNAGNNWTTTWNDLALKANGQDIVYTVEEGTVPGYTTTVDASDKGNVKIINTHTPETTEIKGTKTWADKNNQDGKRPDKITVNLLANGQQMAGKEVTEADGWKYNFTNLPKFQEGQEIVYTVTENDVPEYNTTIEGYDIINSYTPGKTSVTVTKHWEDANNQDGQRPNSIQVQLVANGEAQGDAVELNTGNNWTTTWNDLALKANGQDIVYTVEEGTVPGYTTTVDASDKGNVKIINTRKTVPSNNSSKSKKLQSSTIQKLKKWLPKTGEEKTIWLTVVGVLLISSVLGYRYFKKKER